MGVNADRERFDDFITALIGDTYLKFGESLSFQIDLERIGVIEVFTVGKVEKISIFIFLVVKNINQEVAVSIGVANSIIEPVSININFNGKAVNGTWETIRNRSNQGGGKYIGDVITNNVGIGFS